MDEATYWNGLRTPARKVTGTVADWAEGKDPPLAWWRDLAGQRIPAVEVVLDGVNYGGGIDYLDDRDGTAWAKVTTGHGSPQWGHRNVRLVNITDREAT